MCRLTYSFLVENKDALKSITFQDPDSPCPQLTLQENYFGETAKYLKSNADYTNRRRGIYVLHFSSIPCVDKPRHAAEKVIVNESEEGFQRGQYTICPTTNSPSLGVRTGLDTKTRRSGQPYLGQCDVPSNFLI